MLTSLQQDEENYSQQYNYATSVNDIHEAVQWSIQWYNGLYSGTMVYTVLQWSLYSGTMVYTVNTLLTC